MKSLEWKLISFIPLAANEDQFFELVNSIPEVEGSLIFEGLLSAHVDFTEPVTSDLLQKIFPNASVTPSDSIVAQVRALSTTIERS